LQFGGEAHGHASPGRLSDDLDVRLFFEDGRHACAEQIVIVRDHHADASL
jgi:hypothetical protein